MLRKSIISVTFVVFFLGSYAHAAGIDGLILYFPFNEGSGKVAGDASGIGNDGDINGAEWADNGKIGKALELDGGSFVEVPSSDSLEGLEEEMTIAVWIKPTLTGSGWQGVVTKGNDNGEHFELLINTNGTIHTAWMFSTGRNHTNPGPAGTVQAGEWQHLAVTYRPGEWIGYLNGQELQVFAGADGNLVPDGNPLVVGDERPANRLFEGLIDEVAIFDRALSQGEIERIMNGVEGIISVEPVGKLTVTWGSIKE